MRKMIWFFCLSCGPLVSCGNEPPSPENVLSVEETGGEVTADTLTLDYQQLDLPERHYLVFLQELSLLDMQGFLAEEGRSLRDAAREAGVVTTGPMTSLFYEWDTERGRGKAAVALPVSAETQLPPYVNIKLPASRGLSVEFSGSHDRLSAMHYALDAELQRLGHPPLKPSIEEYPRGPLDSTEETEFRTRIIYPFEAPTE